MTNEEFEKIKYLTADIERLESFINDRYEITISFILNDKKRREQLTKALKSILKEWQDEFKAL